MDHVEPLPICQHRQPSGARRANFHPDLVIECRPPAKGTSRDRHGRIEGRFVVVLDHVAVGCIHQQGEGLRHLVAEAGVGQVIYGTDVPFNWPVTVDLVLNAKFLTDDEKTAILSTNLMKLLRIA